MPRMEYPIRKRSSEVIMGKLVIDGNSFFEIDEECIKKKKISKKCGLDKYLKKEKVKEREENLKYDKK